ncbi:oligosaccharide flippase family protein [Tuberibacillus sp. Marseille-P3662]|uniref:oligosaccharide flippase family protein n=1 Tax=Tuberibacillus sp. Marseille-P3662 TaxID=1965358 RepID=UPI000A1C9FC8|nr:oligosaccharide flippase family protein [Tuberibacillus sp. Marseille-P3662]
MNKITDNLLNQSKKTVLVFGGKVITSLFGYVNLVLLARILNPSSFGYYNIALSYVLIFSVLGVFGLDKLIVKYVPVWEEGNNEEFRHKVNNILSFVIYVAIGVVFVYLFIIYLLDPGHIEIFFIMSLSVFFNSLSIFFRAFNQSINKHIHAVIPEDYIRPTLYFFILFGLYFIYGENSNSEILVALSYTITFFVVFVTAVILFSRNLKLIGVNFCFEFKPQLNKDLIKYAIINMGNNILNQNKMQILIIISGILVASKVVGFVSLGIKTASLISFVLIAINMVLSPIISRLYNKNYFEQLNHYYILSVKILLSIGGLVSIWLIINSEVLFNLFGYENNSLVLVIFIFSVGEIINISFGSVGYLLIMTGYSYINLKINILSNLIVILCLLLLYNYESIGISVSYSLGLSLVNLIGFYFVYYRLQLNPFSRFHLAFMISFFINILLFLMTERDLSIYNLLASNLVAFFIHFTLLLVIGCTKEEKNSLRKILIRLRILGGDQIK